MSKFPLRVVSLVKTGHPLRPPQKKQPTQVGGKPGGGEKPAPRWGVGEGKSQNSGLTTGGKVEEKKRSARPAAAVVTPQLFPEAPSPSLRERQLQVNWMEVLRGSRERPERAPRGGQPRTCARSWRRGVGWTSQPATSGSGGHWGPRGRPLGARGPWLERDRFFYIRPGETACCHHLRFRVGSARGLVALGVPGGAVVISAPSAPPHPAPTRPAPGCCSL